MITAETPRTGAEQVYFFASEDDNGHYLYRLVATSATQAAEHTELDKAVLIRKGSETNPGLLLVDFTDQPELELNGIDPIVVPGSAGVVSTSEKLLRLGYPLPTVTELGRISLELLTNTPVDGVQANPSDATEGNTLFIAHAGVKNIRLVPNPVNIAA